jgi:hypothetical protein
MKQNTLDAFGGDPRRHGGTALLQAIQKTHRPERERKITLLGHSAGAFFVGHFLSFADQMLDPAIRFQVVNTAPACTMAFMQQRLDVYRKRVAHYRLFGLKDEQERSYWEVPLLSRGSLLYIVAGLFEGAADTPLLGMQRYHSGTGPYDLAEITDVLKWLPEKPVWAITDEAPGRRSGSLKHGGFDYDPATLDSVQHLLRNGW